MMRKNYIYFVGGSRYKTFSIRVVRNPTLYGEAKNYFCSPGKS